MPDCINKEVLLQMPRCTIRHGNGEWFLEIKGFTINKGSATLLNGDNMSGKSSLLRALANQQVILPLSLQTKIKSFSTILSTADDPMFRSWSVRDNVFVSLPSISRKGADYRLKKFLERINDVCSWDLYDGNPLYNYSTGAKAFVQLARAIVAQPALYLIDEITPNLDDGKLTFFLDVLEGLRARGTALVMVSHSPRDQDMIIKKLNNSTIMKLGRINKAEGFELQLAV